VQNLSDRANAPKERFNNQILYDNATIAVEVYEKMKTAYAKAKAQEAVDALPAGDVKDALQARIDAVK
jgi:hypothetical protein